MRDVVTGDWFRDRWLAHLIRGEFRAGRGPQPSAHDQACPRPGPEGGAARCHRRTAR